MQLVINSGSSTLKWALFPVLESDDCILSGKFDRLGEETTFLFGRRSARVRVSNHEEAVQYLLRVLSHNKVVERDGIVSVVHRVVHGGSKYVHPVLIDGDVMDAIDQFSLLAPLHNPANLAGIRACFSALPNARQVAVFDTAFHHTIPEEIFLYALPFELYEKFGIRKYGFHGVSHGYIAGLMKEKYGDSVNVISCHLGSGSSITALRGGVSVDTTMGFTPLDGVMMSTRSGDLDPDIPLFLMREGHYSLDAVEHLLEKESGLLGITGHKDLRDVWAAARRGDEKCGLALDMMSYKVAYFINALRTAVPDFTVLVFTGGIGEGAWYIRQHVCEYLKIPLDPVENETWDGVQHIPVLEKISSVESNVDVLVVGANEEVEMHRLSRSVL